MLKFETDRKKGSTSVQFKGDTHGIYKELLNAVVTTLDQMDLHDANGAVPLNESVITFGQHLIMLGTKSGQELNEAFALREEAMRALNALNALNELFGEGGKN